MIPTGIAILAIVVVCIVGNWYTHRQFRRLATQRVGEGYADFCRDFEGLNIPDALLTATWDEFQELCPKSMRPYPVRAVDWIGDVYYTSDEDLDELIERIAEKVGKQLPREGWPMVVTVFNLVKLVNSCEDSLPTAPQVEGPGVRETS